MADLRWTKASFKVLLSEARRGAFRIVVPQLVVQETANKYAERVVKSLGEAARAKRTLERLEQEVEWSIAELDLQTVRRSFETRLLRRLSDVGASIPDYPQMGHEDLVTRLLDARKPFKSEGEGYRDALIWCSILELAALGNAIAFISTNWRDFASSRAGERLHPDLLADLAAARVASHRVELFPDLDSFVQAHVEPARAAVDEVKSLLESDDGFGEVVDDLIREAIERELPPGSGIDADTYEAQPFEDPSFSYIDTTNLHNLEVQDGRRIDSGELYLSLYVEVDADIDAYVHKSELYWLPDYAHAEIMDSDWNDHYGWVSLSKTVGLSLEGRYNPESRALTDLQIVDTHVPFTRL